MQLFKQINKASGILIGTAMAISMGSVAHAQDDLALSITDSSMCRLLGGELHSYDDDQAQMSRLGCLITPPQISMPKPEKHKLSFRLEPFSFPVNPKRVVPPSKDEVANQSETTQYQLDLLELRVMNRVVPHVGV